MAKSSIRTIELNQNIRVNLINAADEGLAENIGIYFLKSGPTEEVAYYTASIHLSLVCRFPAAAIDSFERFSAPVQKYLERAGDTLEWLDYLLAMLQGIVAKSNETPEHRIENLKLRVKQHSYAFDDVGYSVYFISADEIRVLSSLGDISEARVLNQHELYSPEWIKLQVERYRLEHLPLRECSICGIGVGFTISADNRIVGVDSRCNCTTHYAGLRPSSYQDISHEITLQPTVEGKHRIAAKMGLFGPNPPEYAGKEPVATSSDVIVI